MRTFNQWLGLLRPLCDAIAELLWLTRQNGRSRQEIAKGGTFNITFERDNPLQLLRISLPASAGLYPEISGSHHRCSVRFLAWNGLATRPTQSPRRCPVHAELLRLSRTAPFRMSPARVNVRRAGANWTGTPHRFARSAVSAAG